MFFYGTFVCCATVSLRYAIARQDCLREGSPAVVFSTAYGSAGPVNSSLSICGEHNACKVEFCHETVEAVQLHFDPTDSHPRFSNQYKVVLKRYCKGVQRDKMPEPEVGHLAEDVTLAASPTASLNVGSATWMKMSC